VNKTRFKNCLTENILLSVQVCKPAYFKNQNKIIKTHKNVKITKTHKKFKNIKIKNLGTSHS